METKYLNLDVQIKSVDEETFTIRGVFSTADKDRHGEIIDQRGWVLDDYLRNPVVLFAHDHFQPAIGKMVSLGYDEDGNLDGEIKFAAKEYDFARTIFELYKGGYMRAFSVGFFNDAVEYEGEDTVLKKNRLYEVSTVNIPANQMALAKAKGIDVRPLEKVMGVNTDREALMQARDAINKLLEEPSADTETEVEQPQATPTKRAANRSINKAIRALLATKKLNNEHKN